jgi:hypothetical protein
VAEEGLLYGDRVWFADQRTPVRRMAVSCHVENGVFVLSLWQADACTGTFRLPIADAPDLIAKLLDGLGEPEGGPDLRVVE